MLTQGMVAPPQGFARGLAALLGAAAFVLGLTPGSAYAYDRGPSWNPFNTQYAQSYRPPPDLTFARQWEANPPKGYPTLSPDNIVAMKVAIKRYSDVVAAGGFKQVPEMQMQAGSTHQGVAILRERLFAGGDLKEANPGYGGADYYDQNVERAVKRFQASNGLTPTGVVDKRTVAALNVPAAARLRQLRSNLARIAEYGRTAGKRYIMVNIPAAQIEVVDNDRVVSRHAGVVGKIDRQTPILRSQIHELNFNPVWHLPPTVISKDLAPKGAEMQRRGQNVLVKYGIDAYGSDGRKLDPMRINWANAEGLSFRQQPGPENPLGFVKINFHNSHSVYMHDTPSHTLFGRNFRAASSGCVRIAGIEHVAAWLMQEQGWTPERVMELKKSGERVDVRLRRPVPLYFVYITAWATEDGVIQFRRDLYNRDGVGDMASAY